jgi:hypothetical protein
MIGDSAIRGYNGNSNNFFEYRSQKDANGDFALNIVGTVGTTIWEETPISARYDVHGNPDGEVILDPTPWKYWRPRARGKN